MRDEIAGGVAIGDRFVWENPAINLGPFFMVAVRPRGRAKAGHVYFLCIGPNGEPFRKLKAQKIPLPLTMRREDWTDEDVTASAKRYGG